MRVEWTGLLVCPVCFDPRRPELSPPNIDPMEGAPVRNPRPRPPFVELDDDHPVTAADL